MTDLTSFKFFLDLPPGLQEEILILSCSDRYLEILVRKDLPAERQGEPENANDLVFHAVDRRTPTILHVSREVRNLGLHIYPIRSFASDKIHFNPKMDTIYFGGIDGDLTIKLLGSKEYVKRYSFLEQQLDPA